MQENRNQPAVHPTPEERQREMQAQQRTDAAGVRPVDKPAASPTDTTNGTQTRPATEPHDVPSWQRRERTVEQGKPAPALVAPAPALNAAQVIVLTLGIFFVGMGSVGLSRGGFDSLNLHGTVMGIPHTPLLGFMELVFGAVVIMAAALPYAGRWVLAAGGGVLALFGLIVVIAASGLNSALGVEAINGWLYLVCGLVIAAVGVVMPTITTRMSAR